MKIEKIRHRLGGEKRADRPSKPEAQSIALRLLVFLADDDERMGRFLALTGADPGEIRALARQEAFLLALLEHVCADEPALLAFAAAEGSTPESVEAARSIRALSDRTKSFENALWR